MDPPRWASPTMVGSPSYCSDPLSPPLSRGHGQFHRTPRICPDLPSWIGSGGVPGPELTRRFGFFTTVRHRCRRSSSCTAYGLPDSNAGGGGRAGGGRPGGKGSEAPGAQSFERRHDPDIEAKRLQRRIEALGYEVTVTEKAA